MLKSFILCSLLILFPNTLLAQTSSNAPPNTENNLSLTTEELEWIKDHPIIRVANDMEAPPFDFLKNGEAAGFFVDYLNLIASNVGFKIDFINGYTWNELIELTKNREIDIIHGLSRTSERELFLDFTDPIIDIEEAFFGRLDATPITKYEDLVGKKIGLTYSFNDFEQSKDDSPSLDIHRYTSANEAIIALSNGVIDVFPFQIPPANYYINNYFLLNLKQIGKDFLPKETVKGEQRIATRNDWPLLNSILKKGMSAISEEEVQFLKNKWYFSDNKKINKNNIGLTPQEKQWLSQNNSIKVATIHSNFPLENIDNDGNANGISGDYLTAIANILNINFELTRSNDADQSLELIETNKVDMISMINPTNEHNNTLTYTEPYLSLANVIFSRVESETEILKITDRLKGKKIAHVINSDSVELINQYYPEALIIEVANIRDALKMVSNGNADVYIGDIPTASFIIASEGITNINIIRETPYRPSASVGISSDLPLLASSIQKALISMTADEKAAITQKWISLNFIKVADFSLLWKIVGIGLLIVVILSIRNYSLNKEINRRKKVEKKLVITQLNAEISRKKAVEANKSKSSFLANMSHEIRTPLNAIIGFSDLILTEVYGKIQPTRYLGYIADIKSSGEHLSSVIGDILDLSKIEAGMWKINELEFSLDKCIDESIHIIAPLADQKGIKISYDKNNNNSSIKMIGDVHALKRAIINLLSNSIKYSHNNSEIHCIVSFPNNKLINIEIVDTGIRIPEDRIKKVLNPFEQANEDFNLNDKGTGLGLSIVNNLVKLHGGKFNLTSVVGEGTSAIISLPSKRIIS
jgi:signal transduction histidine kinase